MYQRMRAKWASWAGTSKYVTQYFSTNRSYWLIFFHITPQSKNSHVLVRDPLTHLQSEVPITTMAINFLPKHSLSIMIWIDRTLSKFRIYRSLKLIIHFNDLNKSYILKLLDYFNKSVILTIRINNISFNSIFMYSYVSYLLQSYVWSRTNGSFHRTNSLSPHICVK